MALCVLDTADVVSVIVWPFLEVPPRQLVLAPWPRRARPPAATHREAVPRPSMVQDGAPDPRI